MKELIVRFDNKTHKPIFIGIIEPKNELGGTLTTLYGDWKTILTPDKEDE